MAAILHCLSPQQLTHITNELVRVLSHKAEGSASSAAVRDGARTPQREQRRAADAERAIAARLAAAPLAAVAREVAPPTHTREGSNALPIVTAHGMGDSGTNAGMKSICATVPKKYPGAFVLCSTTADGMASIFTKFDKQLAELSVSTFNEDAWAERKKIEQRDAGRGVNPGVGVRLEESAQGRTL